jgi:hypothetical protein
MSDEHEIQTLTNHMDDAFCAAMRAAIEARLENAPIGVVTTPGTKNPRYLPTEQWELNNNCCDPESYRQRSQVATLSGQATHLHR